MNLDTSKEIKIVLSQAKIAEAIEFWLNEKVMRNRCEVSKTEVRTISSQYMWDVTILEDVIVGPELPEDLRR